MFDILVVEDDVNLNQIYCSTLNNNSFNAVPAFDGEEALNIMAEKNFDLVISDIMMPCVDGYELTRQLRDYYPELPILMISAKVGFEDKRSGVFNQSMVIIYRYNNELAYSCEFKVKEVQNGVVTEEDIFDDFIKLL